MRAVHPFNYPWLFAPRDLPYTAPDSAFEREPVTLPHTNVVLPHNGFSNDEYQFISTYRQRFTLPEPLNGRRLYVEFDGAMTSSTVICNGVTLGDHDGGYTPFRFDLTNHLSDGENLLQVRLDSTERPDVPPNGFIVDYLTFGGIYREARLIYLPEVHIADVFVKPSGLLTNAPQLTIDVWVKNTTHEEKTVTLHAAVVDNKTHHAEIEGVWYENLYGELATEDVPVTLKPNSEQLVSVHFRQFPDVERWSIDNPALYGIYTELNDAQGSWLEFFDDNGAFPFGFRHAEFRDDGFYLNGERVQLRGLNRHQTYPYIGGAAPARLQRKDADILKYELGCNIVRTSHYPQSPHFLDRCDEIGLLVFEEIPGWNWIGDNDWKALSLKNVEDMIVRDRNHPSIILWGVRINESFDDGPFYQATNDLAHQLDPTRQTGGVRNFLGSQFLEDVYTFNDFSNAVQEPSNTPHLITEFNGHMFPTKSYDNEERQVEHALRHARVQDLAYAHPLITGAIGWCAFDYNTHREFGAGDRICYHGVSDIWRLPKFAAYFYESQLDPSVRPVLRVASFWTFGERTEAGVEPLYIFSNCDEIEVYKGDELHGRFTPDREAFSHLEHPPFKVMGFPLLAMVGIFYQELRVVGLVSGQPVIEQRVAADGVPHALTLEADDAALHADGADMTRLVFKVVDKYGNRLPFNTCVVQLTLDGEAAELVGENPFALVGGQAAIYLRATRKRGTVTVTAKTPRLPDAKVTVLVG